MIRRPTSARPFPSVALPLAVAALGCAAFGCADPRLPMPMTAAELAIYPPGPALVAYLSQPDATPSVCDLSARGPHLAALDEETRNVFVDGLVDGKIEPGVWERCAGAFLHSAAPPSAAALVDAIGHAYRELVTSSDFETSPVVQARVQTMQRLYVERKRRTDGDSMIKDELAADLRRALDEHRLGPAGAKLGHDLLVTVDMEHGLWQGRPVDVAMIDRLFAWGDERVLSRFAARLPAPALRDEARRRVVRIHIARSGFPEVRAAAAAVEAIVMKQGNNPLDVAAHPPARGWLDASRMPTRGVLVRQAVWQQHAKLVGYGGDPPGVSVLPEVQLRGALLLELPGVSSPVTLCAPSTELDPSPCVLPDDVKVDNPVAYLDKGGAFRFVDELPMKSAVALASGGSKFILPVSVGGKHLLSFDWHLYFERPEDLVFTGPRAGAVGPDLRVSVDRRDPLRFVWSVLAPGGATYLAVVEAPDVGMFHVSSRGARGSTGSAGRAGWNGTSGGACQSGGKGGDGGSGGPGGPGGDGGTVTVEMSCDGPCPDALAFLPRIARSEGGDGGNGGPGGSGGWGGSGGSSRSPSTHTDASGKTVTDHSGCSAGMRGSNGSKGRDGPRGSPGHPGQVFVQMAR